MARYKEYSYGQTKLIPLSFDRQILPGTFEYTLQGKSRGKIENRVRSCILLPSTLIASMDPGLSFQGRHADLH